MGLLRSELIFINPKVSERTELLKLMAQKLTGLGVVNEDYTDKLLMREDLYPTGLPTEPLKFAIPHAETDCVLTDAISIAILDKPIPFRRMDSPQTEVAVNIVIMLAIKNSDFQLTMLQTLMNAFDNKQLWADIIGFNSPEEVIDRLRDVIVQND